jgi:D-arabinose 1-dehydrogenase-like Zn-dependent alcohol dehydrogenase
MCMMQLDGCGALWSYAMKAIVQDRYGGLDTLEYRDIDQPAPKDNEVLVRVHAAGLDRGVWHVMAGLPYLIRFVGFGLRRPKVQVRGRDVAGTVEAVGSNVTQFQPGDEVFGWCDGSYAEYVCASEDHFQPKPATLTFEQAAIVPISAFAALQALRDEGEVQPGQRVLVIGAAGGVGSYAVQLAKAFGAQVTGVASTRQLELVRSSAPTTSSTTPAKMSPTGPASGTSSSTPPAAGPCRSCGGPSPPRAGWSSSAVKGKDGGWAALTATSGRWCCHGLWASGCGC